MVGGVLRCLGSTQRLRTRYGHGYQVRLWPVWMPLNKSIQAHQPHLFFVPLPCVSACRSS